MNSPSSLAFCDPNRLDQLAKENAGPYQTAKPFPHAIFDDFFPPAVAEQIHAEFPSLQQDMWINYDASAVRTQKYQSLSETQMSPFIRSLLEYLNKPEFIRFVETLSGIPHLIPDPDIGQALRHFKRDGRLALHADFNWHAELKLYRRINFLFYLNKDWKDEYGGALELWNETATERIQKILPVFNRCVIFTSTETGYHGVPDPLNCPDSMTRKSIQLYYFTKEKPEQTKIFIPHGTVFKPRPTDPWRSNRLVSSIFWIIKSLTHPALIRWAKKLFKKAGTKPHDAP